MAFYEKERDQATKVTGEFRPPGKGPHDDADLRVAYGLRHLPTTAAWLDRVELTTLSLFRKEDGWLVMLKGNRGRSRLIAWLHASTWADALVLVATTVDSSHVAWQIEETWKPAER